MTAERFEESPKFDQDGSYTKEDFIFRLESLILTLAPGAPLVEVLRCNIQWAERLEVGAVIRWMEREDGSLFPYVEVVVGGFPIVED